MAYVSVVKSKILLTDKNLLTDINLQIKGEKDKLRKMLEWKCG